MVDALANLAATLVLVLEEGIIVPVYGLRVVTILEDRGEEEDKIVSAPTDH